MSHVRVFGAMVFALALVWLLTFSRSVRAADNVWTSQQDRCSLSLPGPEWRIMPLPAELGPTFRVVLASPRVTKWVTLAVSDAGGASLLGSEFRTGFDQGFTKKGNVKISSRDVPLEGQTAYRVVGTTTARAGTVTEVSITLLSHNRIYNISGFSRIGDADTDLEINACINSFHLFDPPDAPNPGPATDPRDAAFRAGQAVGRIVGVVMVVVVVIWLLQRLRG